MQIKRMKYLPLLGIVYVILPIIDGQENLPFLHFMTMDPRRSVENFYSHDARGRFSAMTHSGYPGRTYPGR
jgi:hypothetical protein